MALIDDLVAKLEGKGGLTIPEVLGYMHSLGVETDGDRAPFLYENVILWNGVSSAAIELLKELMNHPRVDAGPTPMLTYAMDGEVLDLPLATPKSVAKRYPYKTLHWIPTEVIVRREPKA